MKEVGALAKKGQHGAAKTVAKTVAMSRHQTNNMYGMVAQTKAMSMQMSAMGTQKTVVDAMAASAGVMAKVNADMNVAGVQSTIRDFTKESMKAEMNQEMIGDAMDFGDANDDADDLYNQILGEVGLELDAGAQVGQG